ncbi:MAG: SEC-C metal-binding domain-containing protein, partial [Methylococcus sp.]
TGLDLAATVDLLTADLNPHPWRDALRLRLAEFEREAIAARLLARLPECLNTYGGQTLAWAMGELGWVEFIPALIDSIAGESVDFINEVARNALTELGAPAQASVISRWDAFDRTRKIYGLSVIQAVAGEPAAEFALNRFDELMALEPEFCLDLTLAHPDPRLLRRLEPELRRRQDLIDRAYYIGARLLGVAGSEVEAAGQRARIAAEKTQQRMAALDQDLTLSDLDDGPLSLELRCPACGDVNWYEVEGVIHPGQFPGEELPCLVADEFPCVSCGQYVEFEFTPRAHMAVMARMIGTQHRENDRDEDEFDKSRVGVMIMPLGGKSVPVALGLRRLRERLAAHPGDLAARAQLGMTLAEINRTQAAIEHLRAVLEVQPKALDVALFLARELDAIGETLEAFEYVRHAVTAPGDWVRLTGTPASSQEFVGFYNALRQELRRIDLPALHISALEPPVKVGRNDPCPCGSGKKYKKCCLQ